jgi:signal transduction histidine kinase
MDGERRDFLSDISHELRTPITVIRGEAEVTLRGADRHVKEYKEALQRILELSMQLGKYVQDLLFLARTETASLQFEWEKIDLAELVLEAEENFQVMAEENGMSVSLTGPEEAVWVRGDKQRLKQILFILVDNACHYSSPGSHIAIDFGVVEKEARISITDNGIGVPAEDLERIFDRHFRSPNARHLRNDGRGLGLSLAKSILKAHHGEITVTSIEHSGSTFTVRLPLLSSHQEPLSA